LTVPPSVPRAGEKDVSDPKRECIMDAGVVSEVLERMADEILSRHGVEGLALVGIRTRGVPLARRLAARLQAVAGADIPVGTLDINLYRDDLSTIADHPVLRKTEIPFAVEGRKVILVDDVLFTGRTVRAALDGMVDLGRPAFIGLAVLVDRGHRELPIHADIVGRRVDTAPDQQVHVELEEIDGKDQVSLDHPAAEGGA
jgi:pyrimidine operon attenuation protein/uracil phosphoribosyltransferase